MNEFMTSLLVIGTEFGVIISIFFIALIVMLIIKKKKDANITTRFKQEIQGSANQRMENLEKSLSSAFNLSGPATKGYAEEIIKNERTIFSNVLKIFHGKDKSLILNLQKDLANLNQTYQDLANQISQQGASSDDTSDAGDSSSSADIERLQSENDLLKDENSRLKEDLKKSLESIDYLQTQYTELFDKTNQE